MSVWYTPGTQRMSTAVPKSVQNILTDVKDIPISFLYVNISMFEMLLRRLQQVSVCLHLKTQVQSESHAQKESNNCDFGQI